MFFEFWKKT